VAYTYFDSLAQMTSRLVSWRPRSWREPQAPSRHQPLPVAGGAGSLEERVEDRLKALRRGKRRRAATA